MRYKIFSTVEKKYPKGASLFYGEASAPTLNSIQISDLTDNVRLNNIYLNSRSTSMAEFLGKIAIEIPRHYGLTCHETLLELLENLPADITSKDPYANSLFSKLKELGDPAMAVSDTKWTELWAKILKKGRESTPMTRVVEYLSLDWPEGMHDQPISSYQTEKIGMLRIIPGMNRKLLNSVTLAVCGVAEVDLAWHVGQNNQVAETAVGAEKEARKWTNWWEIIERNGLLDYPIGKVATLNGIDWPRNRMHDAISTYRTRHPDDLLEMPRLGKMKVNAILECVEALATKGTAAQITTPLSCAEAMKAANLEKEHSRVLELRYLQGDAKTLDACGTALGKTRERMRQIEKLCVERMRIAGFKDNLRAWLQSNAHNIWNHMSEDGGMTVSGSDSETWLNNRLPGEYQLALLIADMNASEFLDELGVKIDDWWTRRDG
jgi:hypothetical protein